MGDEPKRAALLGGAGIEPPRSLRQRSPFTTGDDCLRFLSRALGDADGFWLAAARELHWIEPPIAAGGSGGWFSGGRLDPSGAILERWSRAADGATPLADGAGRAIPAAALAAEVGAACARLDRLGLVRGSRVLLALPRGPDLVATLVACLRLGLVAVPIDPAGGDPGQVARRASAAGCRGTLEDGEVQSPTPELPAAVTWEPVQPAVVFFDSAGRPYSIPVAGLLVQAVSALEWLLRPRADRPGRLWLETPPHHASFTAAALGALLLGIEIVVPGPGAVASAADQVRRIVGAGAGAAIVHGPLLARADPSAAGAAVEPGPLELVVLEGDSIGPGVLSSLRERVLGGAVHVTQAVARPEVGGFVAGSEPGALPVVPGCAGPALPGFDLAVVDQRGHRCEPGLGGFAALGRAVPGLAAELAGRELPAVLGLRARIDRDGRIWPMGEGEVSRPETEHVSATEIETLVAEIDGIEQVAVVHWTDPGGAVRSVLYLETALGEAAAVLARGAIAGHFGPEAVPGAIRAVQRLPVTRSGKLLRSVLRRVAAGDLAGLEQVHDPAVIDGLVASGAGAKEEGQG
jgi:acyl-coenzyme A synthetase/AMP-(fatty) acid ligase